MLGKSPPHLSSLGTITTSTCSTRSSGYISLVIPKVNISFDRLSFEFSAASDWCELQKSLKLGTYISSLTLNISYLSSKPIAEDVHSPSVNGPPNLSTSSPYCFILFTLLLFCTPVSLLTHHHLLIIICSSISPVLIC